MVRSAFTGIVLALVSSGFAKGARAEAPITAEQATRGQAAYARSCLSCHGAALEGTNFGPALKGPAFESHWRERPRAELTEKIRTTMPPGDVGSLTSQASQDIESYITQTNSTAKAPEPMIAPVKPGEHDPLFLAAKKARDAKLTGITSVTESMLERPAPSDWLIWRRTYDARAYSPLRQIDRSNVARLRAAWSWTLPQSSNEITPLVHAGVLFVYSGPTVQALDAATGDLLWQYVRTLSDEFDNGRRAHAKAIAIYGDALFAPTADGHVVALDTHTGRLIWDQEVVARNKRPAIVGWQLTGGPIVAGGKVIIGVSLGVQDGGGCYIVGLDTATGKESWRFHTIARPGEPGGDSWNGAPLEERFGGGVWTAGSFDPDLNLVYFGIGNTYDSATLLEPRPGAAGVSSNDGLYTDSTVALRPDTGALVWHYQHQKRDVWDMDWVFEQSLVTLKVAGQTRKLVVTGGKSALFDAVDAATGAFVFSADVGFQNLIQAVDPNGGAKQVSPAVQPEAGKPKLICPNSFGARNWPATALNPDTNTVFTTILENCADYIYSPRTAAETAQGGLDMRFIPRLPPGHDGNFGRLVALDLQKRRIVWTHRQRIPFASSTLATAGGLLFNGDVDRYFSAYDQANGRILWRTRLNAAPESSPITYAVNGKQYLAVVTGGGSPFGAASRAFVPEVGSPAAGVTLVVFELP